MHLYIHTYATRSLKHRTLGALEELRSTSCVALAAVLSALGTQEQSALPADQCKS